MERIYKMKIYIHKTEKTVKLCFAGAEKRAAEILGEKEFQIIPFVKNRLYEFGVEQKLPKAIKAKKSKASKKKKPVKKTSKPKVDK